MKSNAYEVILCAWLASLMTAYAQDLPKPTSASAVPKAIELPPGNSLAFAATAKGVQIYECRVKKDKPTQFEWFFKAPEADLFDRDGKVIGKHYTGPTWEAKDGSKVLGEIKARADAKDTNAIPWLLLGAKQHEGAGVFSKVTYIQRLDTVGGKSPARSCDGTSAGKQVRVPYTATYYFYVGEP